MTTVVKVKPAFTLHSHSTFEEATAAGRSGENDNIECLNGQVLAAFQFNGANLLLEYENGVNLDISIGDDKLKWSLVPGDTALVGRAPEDILFEFPSGSRFAWNWKSVLQGFLGKAISMKPSDQLLFLHVVGCGENVVNAVIDASLPNRRLLTISEE